MNILIYNIISYKVNKTATFIEKKCELKNTIHNIYCNNTDVDNIYDFVKNIEIKDYDSLLFFVKNYNISLIIANTIDNNISSFCHIMLLQKNEVYKDLNSDFDAFIDDFNQNKIFKPLDVLPTKIHDDDLVPQNTGSIVIFSKQYNKNNNSSNILESTNTDKTIENINTNTVTNANTNTCVSNPKERYREICLSYSKQFRSLNLPLINGNLSNEAVLIEFRILPHLELLVRNMIYNLGSEWCYTIICGTVNYHTILEWSRKINKNIKIIKLNVDNMSQNDYTNLLQTKDFWNMLTGEKILIYQEDTCIFNKNINLFLKYDYVGAPFGPDCVSPINVGNGGFSLRTRLVMLKILNSINPKDFVSKSRYVTNYKIRSNLDLFPEDIFFSQTMQDLNIGTIAPYNKALEFSSEHVFTENSLGMHCLWFCNNKWEDFIKTYFSNIFNQPISAIDTNPESLTRYIKKSENKSQVDNIQNKQLYKDVKQVELNKPTCNFDVYIVHCPEFTERTSMINNLKDILNNPPFVNIHMIDSVNTGLCNIDLHSQTTILEKYNKNFKFNNPSEFTFYKPGQIGCYLGHYMAMKEIAKNKKDGYSIIFEDDSVINNQFISNISSILAGLEKKGKDFDIIYLGQLNNNKGTRFYNNIFEINKLEWIFGAHGLLINNKSASKITEYNLNILHEIDNHYKLLINDDKLKGYYIYPPIVSQNRKIGSRIGFH